MKNVCETEPVCLLSQNVDIHPVTNRSTESYMGCMGEREGERREIVCERKCQDMVEPSPVISGVISY